MPALLRYAFFTLLVESCSKNEFCIELPWTVMPFFTRSVFKASFWSKKRLSTSRLSCVSSKSWLRPLSRTDSSPWDAWGVSNELPSCYYIIWVALLCPLDEPLNEADPGGMSSYLIDPELLLYLCLSLIFSILALDLSTSIFTVSVFIFLCSESRNSMEDESIEW